MNRLESISVALIAALNSETSKGRDFDFYRKSGKLSKQELKELVYGPNWKYRDEMLEGIRKNEPVYQHLHLSEKSREEQREIAAHLVFFTKKIVQMTYDEYLADTNRLSLISNGAVTYDHGFSIKNGVHIFLYTKNIFNLGRERHRKFIEDAVNYRDIGCFGLTELTHGSNVKGLLTEAHYDHKTREFIINTPSKEAMKFWIGAAAELANMSVIWAQLYIDGKCYGVHSYIVPLRDRKTHKLLPGVMVGDCGPKNGNNEIDNGFMMFDHVRIPVENQLDRISGVDENGKFFSIIEGDERRFGIQLGALSGGRFMIGNNTMVLSLNALAIAIRYCCVRRQFTDGPKKQENLLFDYPLTRRRLLPLLAQTVIYTSGNMDAARIWDANYMNILNPENPIIQELHVISSTIKVKSGWHATETIKECRQMLGGHGFSAYSKLGTLYNDNDVNNTWEGDNNVLIQQTTKGVLDAAGKVMKGKAITVSILEFLADPPTEDDVIFSEQNILDLQWARKFLQYSINSKIQDMGMKMLGLKHQKLPNLEIWNNSQVYLGKTIGLTLGDLYYLESSIKKLEQFKDPHTKGVWLALTQLWVLKVIRGSEFVDLVNVSIIERQMINLCDVLAGEALAILESLSACDQVIGSPFACPEGKGFEKYVKIVRERGEKRVN